MLRQFAGIMVLLLTLAMCQVVTSLEATARMTAAPVMRTQAKIVAMQVNPNGNGNSKIHAEERKANEQAVKDVQVLRDSFLMLWICGGIFPGAVVGAILHKATRTQVTADMLVSICTALPLTPYLLKRYSNVSPEECFVGGFIVSVMSWTAWQLVLIIVARVTLAADKRGVAGVKDELMGSGEIKP